MKPRDIFRLRCVLARSGARRPSRGAIPPGLLLQQHLLPLSFIQLLTISHRRCEAGIRKFGKHTADYM